MYEYNIGNATHVGMVRKANEDYYGNFNTPNGHVFVICDGMGGHVGGAKASRIAVESIKAFLNLNKFTDPKLAIHHSILNANNAIFKFVAENPTYRGMGATCVMMLISIQGVFIGHVGDSRIYHYSDGKIYRLTKDHSFVQTLVDMGEITQEQAETHPRKNEILNALGLANMKPPTIRQEPLSLQINDIILLCTDGLTGIVNDRGIMQVLKSDKSIQAKADELVALANQGGGTDNITLQLIEFNQVPSKNYNRRNDRKFTRTFVVAIIAIIFLIIAGILGTNYVFKNNEKTSQTKLTDTIPNEIKITINQIDSNNKTVDDKTSSNDQYYVVSRKNDPRQNNRKNQITLLNPKDIKQPHRKYLTLKSFNIVIENYKDTAFNLKYLIQNSTFENIDTMVINYELLSNNELVKVSLDTLKKSISFSPNKAKNGTSKIKIWVVGQRGMSPLSDTAIISFEIKPIVKLKKYIKTIHPKEKVNISIKDIISEDSILGYEKSRLSIKLEGAPSWVTQQKNFIILNSPRKPNASFLYHVYYEQELIGSDSLIIRMVDN